MSKFIVTVMREDDGAEGLPFVADIVVAALKARGFKDIEIERTTNSVDISCGYGE